jgi:hypothetical protein
MWMIVALSIAFVTVAVAAPKNPAKPTEEDYYRLMPLPLPSDCVLEIGGMGWLDKAQTRLLACTRRGELWVIDNPYADPPALAGQKIKVKDANGKKSEVEPDASQIVRFTRMLFGLHEPLGMVVNPGHGFPDGIYMAQRSELTRVVDENGDDRIDLVETFCNQWETSGGYHEFAFGPKLGSDGMLYVTLNRPFGEGQEGTGYWRGWAVKVDNKGNIHPVCPGLRSPAGLGTANDGEMFYTDNQGDHVASGKLAQLKPGVFHGNPIGLQSCDHPLSNFKLPFKDYPKLGMPWPEAVKVNPHLQAPAVWFPYPDMGRSQTDVLMVNENGKFGPFDGQTLVGDLSNAIILRVFLEKIDGEYQGACFPFRRGFEPPVLRMLWGRDGSLFVGGSSRGWGGGAKPYGLERVVWTGDTPFEVLEMRAKPDGFELTFTEPVAPGSAADVKSYSMKSWMYFYYSNYGDKLHDEQDLTIKSATVAPDGKSVRLVVDGLKPYYVHALRLDGVRNKQGVPLLHPEAYYTLNHIPKD